MNGLISKTERDSQTQETNLWLSKGKVEWEAEIKRVGLTYTHYV